MQFSSKDKFKQNIEGPIKNDLIRIPFFGLKRLLVNVNKASQILFAFVVRLGSNKKVDSNEVNLSIGSS